MSDATVLTPGELAARARRIVRDQNTWRGSQTLNLIASENLVSPGVAELTVSDFSHRYAEGEVGKRYYEGTRYVDEVEDLCEKTFNRMFGSEYSNVKPLSGAQANLAVFMGLAKPGDDVASLDVPNGGHISYREFGAAGCRGLTVNNIPFNPAEFTVDTEGLAQLLQSKKKTLRVVTLGGSLILFPHPVREVSRLVSEYFPEGDVVVHYDAAHVFGLIAGGRFQDPFSEGAKVVSSSTHKTFPGPQGGVVLAKSLDAKKTSDIRKAVFPGLVSNHHLHRLPALLYAAAEMMEFGSAYADQTIRNAKRLAKSLHDHGFKVVGESRGFTESHQVAFDSSDMGGGSRTSSLLASANIITNKNLLPGEPLKNSRDPSGIRIGVQEVTRIGMKEAEMDSIAELFHELLHLHADASAVAAKALKLRQEFPRIHFTFT
ncbi:MAG: serine hydroxymethyltransferase [Candidatus Marsarchaeota archaeon]|nr:serine hydroxymethyltransferase [Candidatus Marsarchaeota archaeon]